MKCVICEEKIGHNSFFCEECKHKLITEGKYVDKLEEQLKKDYANK